MLYMLNRRIVDSAFFAGLRAYQKDFRHGTALTAEQVIAHCREQIAGYKCPKSVDFRDKPLPLSGAGKILKRDLREPYWKGFTKAVN